MTETVRRAVKTAMKAVLPHQSFERIMSERSRSFQLRQLHESGGLDSVKEYIQRFGTIVRYGPFAGMIYPLDSALSRFSIPKMIGSYESEAHFIFEECLFPQSYDAIIDIGCAEGYYVVGLARLLGVKVYAFDPEPRERFLCQAMADLNGVRSLIEYRDLFRVSDVASFASMRMLVICDCEGFEAHLFTPESIRSMANWDLLIELHGACNQTLPRLPWPHVTKVIPTADKPSFPELDLLSGGQSLSSERRADVQSWLWCRAEVS